MHFGTQKPNEPNNNPQQPPQDPTPPDTTHIPKKEPDYTEKKPVKVDCYHYFIA